MIRFRPLLMMTALTLMALAVLVALGRWQWEKYELKTALAGAPVAEMEIASYEPLVEGVQFVWGVQPGGIAGWRLFVPVRYGETIVFVDSEFIEGVEEPVISEVRVPPALRFGAPIRGAALRPDPPAAFSRPPQLERRLWFDVDLAAMGRRAGLENVADYYLATSYVGADGRAEPNPFARAPGADPLPPARHMGYALTWWGIAVVLGGVYLAYHASVGRLSIAAREPED